jgi:hypothetical protein
MIFLGNVLTFKPLTIFPSPACDVGQSLCHFRLPRIEADRYHRAIGGTGFALLWGLQGYPQVAF